MQNAKSGKSGSTALPANPLSSLSRERVEQVIAAELVSHPDLLKAPTIQRVLVQSHSYKGPAPHEKQFAEYEKAVPGAGMELLALSRISVEGQVKFNHDRLAGDLKEAGRGQWMAFAIAMTAILGGVTLGVLGHPWPGALFGTGGLAAIVYLFIQGKKR